MARARARAPGAIGGARAALGAIAAAAAIACGPATNATPSGIAWPGADRLFHASPSWRGGDGASSIDLGGHRSLWLFGDSFVARAPGGDRRTSTFVHNTIALQTGADPSRASIVFAAGGADGAPASYFDDPAIAPDWYWPAGGIRLEKRLILFLTRVRRTGDGAFGFANVGWRAAIVDDPDAPLSAWAPRFVDPPAPSRSAGWILGVSPLALGGAVYVHAVAEPAHDVYLVRWDAPAVAAGDLGAPRFWDGAAFVDDETRAAPVLAGGAGGATELSVQADPTGPGFVMVQTVGFGAAALAVRRAPVIVGPWSAPVVAYVPPEGARPGAFVYAGKGHAELEGAVIVATYASNTFDVAALLADESLYYPRFVRVNLPQISR